MTYLNQSDQMTVNGPGVGSGRTEELFARREEMEWREQWDSRRGLERHKEMLRLTEEAVKPYSRRARVLK
jgi:hypothetical protein